MSQTRYRKQVTTSPAHPSDGDYYAIGISPPSVSDETYCRVTIDGRNWGGSGRRFDTRKEAIAYIRHRLNTIEQKAHDDRRRGSINHYPEPPTPSNTAYVVHPDYENEIGPREIWGDTTLGAFGVASRSRFENQPWYQTREEYDTWGKPICGTDTVLQVSTERHGSDTLYWFTARNGSVMMVEYRAGGSIINVSETSWTFLTRIAGGIGLIYSVPNDCQHLSTEDTPFRVGTSEDAILAWLDQHQPEFRLQRGGESTR